VLPDEATIRDGSYAPLSRPLYIYVKKSSLQRPEVRAFVDFYLKNAGGLASEVGYVPLPDQMYLDGLAKLK
jgi:phosphate transport system substrate-binding protein